MVAGVERSGAIKMLNLYEYEEEQDAECDLCSRRGAVMFYFSISSACSSKPPPAAGGWLGHMPCIHWLASSALLVPFAPFALNPASSHSTADDEVAEVVDSHPGGGGREVGTISETNTATSNTIAVEQMQEGSAEVQADSLSASSSSETGLTDEVAAMIIEERMPIELHDTENLQQQQQKVELLLQQSQQLELQPASTAPLSRFDTQLGLHRCVVCGGSAGVTLRCCALACTVRAHALCVATSADHGWVLCQVKPMNTEGNAAQRDFSCISCFCPVHSRKSPSSSSSSS
jgi:hypothetical protein